RRAYGQPRSGFRGGIAPATRYRETLSRGSRPPLLVTEAQQTGGNGQRRRRRRRQRSGRVGKRRKFGGSQRRKEPDTPLGPDHHGLTASNTQVRRIGGTRRPMVHPEI